MDYDACASVEKQFKALMVEVDQGIQNLADNLKHMETFEGGPAYTEQEMANFLWENTATKLTSKFYKMGKEEFPMLMAMIYRECCLSVIRQKLFKKIAENAIELFEPEIKEALNE